MEPFIKKIRKLFEKGKPLSGLYPLFEAVDSFLMTTGKRTQQAPHVRDSLDLKRVMSVVVLALLPCLILGIYNVGLQMQRALGEAPSIGASFSLGLQKVVPILLVTYLVGGFWEVLFACVRKHEINEGFFVTGIVFALTLPPTIPLWQAAVGISFGVVVGKEVFGGTGMNIMNPALVGRIFLFFAYPAQMSGDAAWVAVDGFTKATPLAVLAEAPKGTQAVPLLVQAGYHFSDSFWGFIPGSIGETSTAACLFGLIFLLVTGIASWRIVSGCVLGLLAMSTLLSLSNSAEPSSYFSLPPYWHLVLGGFAFGAIFMATDPVTSCATDKGRWIFGFLIGVLVVLIRVFNPAYPEGTMLAILLMNIFAPLIDYFIVKQHIKWRMARAER